MTTPRTAAGRALQMLLDERSEYRAGVGSKIIDMIAAIEAEAAPAGALREALERIKRDEGKVCDEFESCTHVACASSYNAWATSDAALAPASPSAAPLDVERLARALEAHQAYDGKGFRHACLADCAAAIAAVYGAEEGT